MPHFGGWYIGVDYNGQNYAYAVGTSDPDTAEKLVLEYLGGGNITNRLIMPESDMTSLLLKPDEVRVLARMPGG